MLEFVAIGPQGGQRWRRPLPPDTTIRLGRAPASGWAVPWDLRISREHCEMQLMEDRLYVRVLDVALNPAYRLGEPTKEFSIAPGEAFRIGQTTFRIDRVEARQTIAELPDQFDAPGFADKSPAFEAKPPASDFKKAERAPWPAEPAEPAKPAKAARPIKDDIDSLRIHIDELRAKLAAANEPEVKEPEPVSQEQIEREEVQRLRAEIESLKYAVDAPKKPERGTDSRDLNELNELVAQLRKQLAARGSADEDTLPRPARHQPPVQEAPVQEAPVQEAPVQEAPVQEAPVREAPVQEAPVRESPTPERYEPPAPAKPVQEPRQELPSRTPSKPAEEPPRKPLPEPPPSQPHEAARPAPPQRPREVPTPPEPPPPQPRHDAVEAKPAEVEPVAPEPIQEPPAEEGKPQKKKGLAELRARLAAQAARKQQQAEEAKKKPGRESW